MQITKVEKLVREFYNGSFSCMACNIHNAEVIVFMQDDRKPGTFRFMICNGCKNIGEDSGADILWDMLAGKDG